MARDFSKAFYHSKEWGAVRDYCMKRDNYLCVHCGAPVEEVHHKIHLSPANIGDPNITLNPDNLICLCKACHFAEHRGQHGSGRKKEDDYPYTFDADGNLIKKF